MTTQHRAQRRRALQGRASSSPRPCMTSSSLETALRYAVPRPSATALLLNQKYAASHEELLLRSCAALQQCSVTPGPRELRRSHHVQGDHEKPDKQLQAANVQAQQPKGLKDAAQQPEKQRQVSLGRRHLHDSLTKRHPELMIPLVLQRRLP